MAALDALARRHRGGRQGADRAARDLSALCARSRRAGSTRRCAPRVLRLADADGFARARRPGRRARPCMRRSPSCSRRGAGGRDAERVDRRDRGRMAGIGLDERRDRRAVRGARRRASTRSARRPMRCAQRVSGDARQLRRQPQHQLHQHLLLPLPVLRLLQGQARRAPARPAYDLDRRRDRAPRAAKPGSAAPPKSACRAASIRATPATPISRSAARSKRAVPGHARPCLLAARGAAMARPRSAFRVRRLPRRAAAPRASARCPAPRPKSSTTRCAPCICPGQGHDRSNGST